MNVTVFLRGCAMGRLFGTKLPSEDETPLIANELLAYLFFLRINFQIIFHYEVIKTNCVILVFEKF